MTSQRRKRNDFVNPNNLKYDIIVVFLNFY